MDRFDVILLGLANERTRRQTIEQLKTMFSMDEQMAVMMLATAPTTVKRDMTSETAERYYYALTAAGLRVELRKHGQAAATVQGHGVLGEAPGSTMDTERPPGPAAGDILARPISTAPQPGSFWASIPEALKLPLQGRGLKWLLACSMYGAVFMGFIFIIALMFAGTGGKLAPLLWFVLAFLGGSAAILVGLIFNYFRSCLWAVLSGEDEPQSVGEVGPAFILNDLFKMGLMLCAFLLALNAVTIIWLVKLASFDLSTIVASPLVWLLVLFGSLYWPMGLGLAAVQTSPIAFWDFPRGIKFMLGAPLEYAVLTIVGNATYWLPVFGIMILGILGGPLVSFIAAIVLVGPPLAYSHAVQGALLAHIFRLRPELFEE